MGVLDCFKADVLVFKGYKFDLRIYFDVIIKSLRLQDDDLFTDVEKIMILSSMLVENTETLQELTLNEQSELVNQIYDQFIYEKDESKQENKDPLFDLMEDFDYIYASFLYDYKIDLIEAEGLHWKKFLALLNNLSDESKFKQVVRIRTMEIPVQNKYNAKERAEIIRLKQHYALKKTKQSREEIIKSIDDKFSSFAKQLRQRNGGRKIG